MNINRISDATLFSNLSQRLIGSLRHSISAPRFVGDPAPVKKVGETGKGTKRILVPLDGTALAEHAIPLALSIAKQCEAVLQLVHVLVPADEFASFEMLHCTDAMLKDKKASKLEYLSKIAHRITATAPVGVSSTVIQSENVSTALERYYNGSSDLIVMATHGRGLLGRFWWGSTAHSILQRTAIPIILVHGNNEQPSFDPQSIDDVILPIASNKQSEKIVEPLLKLGLFPNACHSLLHVTRAEPALVHSGGKLRNHEMSGYSHEAVGMEYMLPATKALYAVKRRYQTKIKNSQKPIWQAISEYVIDRSERSLIACTYRSPRPFERLMRPPTAEHLLQTTKCPLMLIPS